MVIAKDFAKLQKILKVISVNLPDVKLKYSINQDGIVCACIHGICLSFKNVRYFTQALCFLYDAKFSRKALLLRKKENYKKKNLFFYWLENVAKYTTNKELKLEELKAEFNGKYGKEATTPTECTEQGQIL